MKETQHSRRIGRSIGALLMGIFAGAILSFGTDELLHSAGIFPALGQPMNDALLLLATAYRTVYSVVGSYIVARLAPDRPMQHAMASGIGSLVHRDCGHSGDVESRTRVPLVFPCHYRTRDAVRLGGRETWRDAVARTC